MKTTISIKPAEVQKNWVLIDAEGQLYGIRFEEKARNQWEADWAFPIREKTAKNDLTSMTST